MAVRFTERANEITTALSHVPTLDALRLLRQVDSQLFTGYGTAPFIPDSIHELIAHASSLLQVAFLYSRVP